MECREYEDGDVECERTGGCSHAAQYRVQAETLDGTPAGEASLCQCCVDELGIA